MTDSLLEVSEALHQHLVAGDLPVQDIWFDIRGLVPRTPCIMVEPLTKNRELVATGFQVTNTFIVGITIVHSRMASEQITNAECISLAEQVENHIHTDRRLDNRLIHSFVASLEQGSVTQQKVLLRATRLTWNGISKTRV